MTTWLLIRRLRGPAFLILFGITAMLNQWGVLGFGRSWPLYLILAGLLGLAERAALAMGTPGLNPGWYPPSQPYPGQPYPAPAQPYTASPSPAIDPLADPNRRP
jgi:hypothetical protein